MQGRDFGMGLGLGLCLGGLSPGAGLGLGALPWHPQKTLKSPLPWQVTVDVPLQEPPALPQSI